MQEDALKEIQEAVRAKIQAETLAVLPEQCLRKLVLEEVERFINSTERPHYGNPERVPSGLQQVVDSVLVERTKAMVEKAVSEHDWVPYQDGITQTVRTAYEDVVERKAGAILARALNDVLGAKGWMP